MPIPMDYLERVYAGVLGKLIGVYMGRPFEGWTHQRILKELGHVRYFVNEKLGLPIVVTDDDISGTFTFVRALEEHYVQKHHHRDGSAPSTGTSASASASTESEPDPPISAEQIGKTWLNTVIKNRTVFWWGGNGVSTEHTAFVNLKRGIAAPRSGAAATNGRTVAQQIGGQIFVDGFAMAAPGDPGLAARLAGAAASVSHDGEAVHAARLWAAMEAEAFVARDVGRLLDVGLRYVPPDSLIAALVADVRAWCKIDGDWMRTRQRIEDKYGYDKFPGFCHVVPNHGIMIMTLIYGGDDFSEAMHIVNTSGWDTDCNSGNVGCLVAIMHGLAAFEDSHAGTAGEEKKEYDWREPLADRVLISSADGGYSINNAAKIAYDIVNMGRLLAGQDVPPPPKDGAQFHFSLPGSVQGFRVAERDKNNYVVVEKSEKPGLEIVITGRHLTEDTKDTLVLTDTFIPSDINRIDSYELVASPLVYPGQVLRALVATHLKNYTIQVRLILKAYTHQDKLETFVGDPKTFRLDESSTLEWTIPATLGSRPIQAVGIAISSPNYPSFAGSIRLHYLRWDGTPTLILEPGTDEDGPRIFYKHSFVNGADVFALSNGTFVVAQDQGEGLVSYGTREWTNYEAVFENFTINVGGPAGVAARVRGLNRYYALFFWKGGSGGAGHSANAKRISIVKALDEQRIELAGSEFEWEYDVPYTVTLEVEKDEIRARVGDTTLSAHDTRYPGGGTGFVATDGSVLADRIKVNPLKLFGRD